MPENAANNSSGTSIPLEELAAKFGMDSLREIPDAMLDAELIKDLSVDWARNNATLPVRYKGKEAALVADPANVNARKYLSLLLGIELTPVLAEKQSVLDAIERCYYSRRDSASDFLQGLGNNETAQAGRKHSADLLESTENAPVTQLVNLFLLEAVKAGASDIHFEPFESRLRVRFRIDGILYAQASPPKNMEAALVSRLKIMAHLDIAEKRLPQDGVARVRVGEREIDIRVSTVPVAEGERVVLRLLSRSSALLPLAGLGMPPDVLAGLEATLKLPHGIVIVCGPTGSGKTTTLYAALQRLDTDRFNILTIEDPIEYQLPDIGQIQIKPKIGLTFASGLRHILRQDPDTILLGEIRDLESAEIAVRASLTGHMVFSTLHTNDAPSAAIRMMDMGIEPYLLASSLRAALAQRLVRRLCEKCRKTTSAEEQGVKLNPAIEKQINGKPLWQAAGCPECLGGFHGRAGIFELMLVTPEIQEFLRSGRANARDLMNIAVNQGMTTLVQNGIDAALAGITTLPELMRAAGSLENHCY